MRTIARLLVPALAAAALAVAGSTPAHAGTRTLRTDDGTRESALMLDDLAPTDAASKDFRLRPETIATIDSATLWIYGKAERCHVSGPEVEVFYGGRLWHGDPCAKWPTTGYGWVSFAVPPSSITWWGGVTVLLSGTVLPPESTEDSGLLSVGIDTTTDGDDRITQDGEALSGHLMAYLEITGTTSALVSPGAPGYGVVPIGSTATRTMTFTSAGLEPATVSAATITGGNAADYAITADTCTGATLAYDATCAVTVAFTPSGIGPRAAILTLSGTATASRALDGEGRSAPPGTTIATPAGMLGRGSPVTGGATDDLGVAFVMVTYDPDVPVLATAAVRASLACDPGGSPCTWTTTQPLLAPGWYTVSAAATDVQGIADPSPASVRVLVV